MKHSFIISIAYIVRMNQVLVQTRDGHDNSQKIEYYKDYQQSKNKSMLEIFWNTRFVKSYTIRSLKY